jgi:hypothetical protein
MRLRTKGRVNHHYIPQCYLRQFAIKYRKAHQLSVFDRKTGSSRKANVRNVSCQNAFNRIHLDGMNHNALEEAMSEFETKLAETLVRINDARSLANEDDRAYLITLVGLTGLRNPSLRETIRKTHDDTGKRNLAARLQSKQTYDSSVAEAKRQGALPEGFDVSYEEMKQAFEGGGFKLVLSNNDLISHELQLLDHCLPLLFRRRWRLMRAPEGSGGFITSDRPFFLTWSDPAMRGSNRAPGIAVPHTQIYFPVSPTLALVGAFEIEHGADDIDIGRVALMNGAMVQNASREVYSRNHGFSYTMTLAEPSRQGTQLVSDKRFRGPVR